MHELSIALTLLDAVADESARRGNVRVLAVHIKLGPLAGVVRPALLSAFDLAREGTDLADCQLVIKDIPLVVHCDTCAADRTLTTTQLLCPVCGQAAGKIISGEEMDIAALEIATDEHAPAG